LCDGQVGFLAEHLDSSQMHSYSGQQVPEIVIIFSSVLHVGMVKSQALLVQVILPSFSQTQSVHSSLQSVHVSPIKYW